jgi:hypothetical protein
METKLNFMPKTQNIRRFTMMETNDFFVIIGTDKTLRQQQVLQILKRNDTQKNYTLKDILVEDKKTYDQETCRHFLLELKARFSPVTMKVKIAYGILGFIRFTKGYYLVLITSRKRVSKICKHSIYTVREMQLIAVFNTTTSEGRDDENRYLQFFKDVNIEKGFYYSYTYDLTRSLQENMMRKVRNG